MLGLSVGAGDVLEADIGGVSGEGDQMPGQTGGGGGGGSRELNWTGIKGP